ncbi:hypothetical protein ACFVH6_45065 [Spirillospora sp. NPDC127200]
MSRRTQGWSWTAALVLTALPLLFGLVVALVADKTSWIISSAGIGPVDCTGWQWYTDLNWLPVWGTVRQYPIVAVATGFLLWWRVRRAERIAAWATALFLALVSLPTPLLFGLDMIRDEGCLGLWEPFVGWTLAWSGYYALPMAVVLATVLRVRRRPVAALLALGLVLAVAGDHRPGPADGSWMGVTTREDCPDRPPLQTEKTAAAHIARIAQMPLRERERAYICMVRGFPFSPTSWESAKNGDKRTDWEVLAEGRSLCRAEEEKRPLPIGRRGEPVQIAYLCPGLAARTQAENEVRQRQVAEEGKRDEARYNAYCRRLRKPGAVRQGIASAASDEGGAYYLADEEYDETALRRATDEAIDNGMVGVGRGIAVLQAGETDAFFCLAARAYRKPPPVELKGWDRVVEVGVDAPAGRLRLGDMGTPEKGLPVLTLKGPGSYRVRIHDRFAPAGTSGDLPEEAHLIVVFPGESKQTKVYKGKLGR